MDYEKDQLKVYNYTLVPVTLERITQMINALQLAKQNMIRGQTQILPVHPDFAFIITPENGKKIQGLEISKSTPVAEGTNKDYVDRAVKG